MHLEWHLLRLLLGCTICSDLGHPPSYPFFLTIPGLSAPLPEGCQWGFHPGGWGKPPVDEHNRPFYGDVFGLGIYMSIRLTSK